MLRSLLKLMVIVFAIWQTPLHSQHPLNINMGVDTNDAVVRKALTFYQNYLNDFHHDTLPDFRKYWSAKDCAEFKVPDQSIYAVSSEYPTFCMGFEPTVYYIKPIDSIVIIKTIFSSSDSTGVPSFLCACCHYIRIDTQHQPQFILPSDYYHDKWQRRRIQQVEYTYPLGMSFNTARADSLQARIRVLEERWKVKPIAIRYYMANTQEELDVLRGIEFSCMTGNRDKPSGISNVDDRTVYCSGLGENYFHEVVHVYLNRLNVRCPLLEGLAQFYGGSMGRDLAWHLRRLKATLQTHPEYNLSDVEHFGYFDNLSNPGASLKGLVCQLIYDKNGIEGLQRLIKINNIDEIIEQELGVKRPQWDSFFREKLKMFK